MQKPRNARTALITLPVAGALLLAGCSGGPQSGALNSATPIGPPAASSPTTSTPTLSSAPKTQDPNSDAALIAATLAYIEANEKAHVSMNTAQVRRTFAKGCIICEKDVTQIDGWAKQGFTVVGGQVKWSTPTIASRNANGVTILRVMASTKAGLLKDAAGKTVETFSASPPNPAYFHVRTIKGKAVVIGIAS